jgi:hypothetical protein
MGQEIDARQVKNTPLIKLYITDPGGAGIAKYADIVLPDGWNTATDKFLVFVNNEYWYSVSAYLGVDANYIYASPAGTDRMRPANNIAAGSAITIIKIPGAQESSGLFGVVSAYDTWI